MKTGRTSVILFVLVLSSSCIWLCHSLAWKWTCTLSLMILQPLHTEAGVYYKFSWCCITSWQKKKNPHAAQSVALSCPDYWGELIVSVTEMWCCCCCWPCNSLGCKMRLCVKGIHVAKIKQVIWTKYWHNIWIFNTNPNTLWSTVQGLWMWSHRFLQQPVCPCLSNQCPLVGQWHANCSTAF